MAYDSSVVTPAGVSHLPDEKSIFIIDIPAQIPLESRYIWNLPHIGVVVYVLFLAGPGL